MAYNNKDKKEEVIADIKKNDRGDYIRVTKVISKDDYDIDVRNMYTNDAGEVCFTQKGVRFGGELLTEVLAAIIKAADEADIEEAMSKAGYDMDITESDEEESEDSAETEI